MTRLSNVFLYLLCTWLLTSICQADDWLATGERAYQQGHFTEAAHAWQQALSQQPDDASAIALKLAAAYQANGALPQAIELLAAHLDTAQQPLNTVLLHKNLADLYRLTQQLERAQQHLDTAYQQVAHLTNPDVLAAVLHSQAQLLAEQGYYSEALTSYQNALHKAYTADNDLLASKILLNQVHVHLQLDAQQAAIQTLKQAFKQLQTLPDDYAKTFLLLTVVQFSHDLALPLQTQALAVVNQLADSLQQPELQAYAKGYAGQYALAQQDYPRALAATRQAIFHAQRLLTSNNLHLYRWYWQLGKIFQQTQVLDSAITAYQNAVHYLQPIRLTLITQQQYFNQSFTDSIAQVYLELMDLLLYKAETVDGAAQQALLRQVLLNIEQLRTAELEDYFQEPCVTIWDNEQDWFTQYPHSAVLYPVLLPQRLVLLLQHAGRLHAYTVSLNANTFLDSIMSLRFELQNLATAAYLPHAQQLYQWLLKPLQSYLTAQAIKNIVVVPDATLRNIPFAVLHDGEQFAVQHWAFAVTPSLQLTAPRLTDQASPKVMLNGLSDAVQGFAPLPAVSSELQQIQAIYGATSVYLNEGFVLQRLERSLAQTAYNVLHIASHGEFSSDPQQTFVLTYDGKLHMDRLEALLKFNQARHEPLDLLTLSACKTAYGDARAALGLAGVAVKAGARSALATLWYVDDKATAELIVTFYRALQQPDTSKARALQLAQQHLLQQPIYQHPLYWSGFLLVGNWL